MALLVPFPARFTHGGKSTPNFFRVALFHHLSPTSINLDPFPFHILFNFGSFRFHCFGVLAIVETTCPEMSKMISFTDEHLATFVPPFESAFNFLIPFGHSTLRDQLF